MDFVVDQFRFLGLNEREVKVFTALATFGRMNMTKLAKRSGLPRTTVDAIIRRLVEQGLVVQERVRGHTEYSVVLHDIAERLDWLEKRLRPINDSSPVKQNDEELVINNEHSNEKSTSTTTVESAFHEHEGERVRVLLARGVNGIDNCVERLCRYVHLAVGVRAHIEILACAHVADALHLQAHNIETPPQPDMVRLNVVPLSYCASDSDAIMFRDVVLIPHNRNGTVQRVEQVDAVEMMKHLLDIACETGWSVNLAAWLEEV